MRLLNQIQHIKNWKDYLKSKYSGKIKSNAFNFKLYNGWEINVPARLMHTFKESFFDDAYFKGFPFKFSKNETYTIIDVGANVGYFSIYALSKLPKAKVISFEPMPQNFALLSEYQNQLKTDKWLAHNLAVSADNKPLTLHFNASDEFTTSAGKFGLHPGDTDVLEVPSVTLKEVIKSNKLEHIDLLKLDCEGSEYDILYNCPDELWGKIKNMAIETHQGKDTNENQQSLEIFLQKKGYKTNADSKGLLWAWS
jgi:FkbM family methyltransferase